MRTEREASPASSATAVMPSPPTQAIAVPLSEDSNLAKSDPQPGQLHHVLPCLSRGGFSLRPCALFVGHALPYNQNKRADSPKPSALAFVVDQPMGVTTVWMMPVRQPMASEKSVSHTDSMQQRTASSSLSASQTS